MPTARTADLGVTFAGHSTALIELDGARVLTDPILRDRLLHLTRLAPPVDLRRWRDPELILISHSHLDHLDRRTLKLLGGGATVVAPRDVAGLLRRIGFKNVAGVAAGESVEVHGLKVTATPAVHGGRRLPWKATAETIGFTVTGSQSFYFAGDTDLFPEMADLGPGIDLALLPVWGWGEKLGKGHLDPERATEATRRIAPRVAIPVHWGGYLPARLHRRRPELLTEPPREYARLVRQMGLATQVEVLDPGSSFTLAPGDGGRLAEEAS